MKKYYTPSSILELKKDRAFYIGALAVGDSLLLTSFLLFFCFLSRDNRAGFTAALIAMGLLLVWLTLYLALYRLAPMGKYLEFARRMSLAKGERISGKVKSIGLPISSPYEVKLRLVELENEEGVHSLFLDEEIPMSFREGESKTFLVASSVILGEESKDEERYYSSWGYARHLSRFWPLYLLLSAVVVSGTLWGEELKLRPKTEEKISLFSVCLSADGDALQKDMKARDDGLLEVSVLNYSPNTPSLLQVVGSAGFVDTDLLLLPRGLLPDSDYPRAMAEVKEGVSSYFVPSLSYFDVEGKHYGILFSPTDLQSKRVKDYFSFPKKEEGEEASYLLCFNPSSVNLGLLGENSLTDRALKAASFLWEEEP